MYALGYNDTRFIYFSIPMIHIPAKDLNLKLLTPEQAQEYLKTKPQYLATWNKIIKSTKNKEAPFEAKDFCNIIDTIKTKRIESKEKIAQKINNLEQKNPTQGLLPDEIQKLKQLKAQKNESFSDALTDIFGSLVVPKIKGNKNFTYLEVNQLIGSLAKGIKTPKEQIQEFTISVNEWLHENLSKLEIYAEEISATKDDLKQQYFHSKGLGNAISESEEKEFGEQALYMFKQHHKEEIEAKKIDINTLNTYLHRRGII